MFALVSLPGQIPSTRRVAPAPETRTPEKPKSRNFRAIRALSTNRSTDLRARIARYRFPWWTINSAAKLEAMTKVTAMAKAARAVSDDGPQPEAWAKHSIIAFRRAALKRSSIGSRSYRVSLFHPARMDSVNSCSLSPATSQFTMCRGAAPELPPAGANESAVKTAATMSRTPKITPNKKRM